MWIGDYMAREGIESVELAARVREYGKMQRVPLVGRVSMGLIDTLNMKRGNGYTHPRFADAIAAVCGATCAQRDMIVSEQHRGTWRMTDAARERAQEAERRARRVSPWRDMPIKKPGKVTPDTGRAVVMVDKGGHVVKRYPSVISAAQFNGLDRNTVREKCQERRKFEFFRGVTFRYADVWEKMSNEERERSLSVGHGNITVER